MSEQPNPFERAPVDEDGNNFVRVRQYEEAAGRVMRNTNRTESVIYQYWSLYADDREVVTRSRAAFNGIFLTQRCLAGHGKPDLTTEVFGEKVMPFGVAPTAFHKLVHEAGEAGTARGVADLGGIYCYNYVYSTVGIEEVAKIPGAKWLGLYMHPERSMIEAALDKAVKVGGFSAVVVTVDHPHDRVRDEVKPAFNKVDCDPLDTNPNGHGDKFDASRATWDDLAWLCRRSTLPVVAKGILTVEDAKRAVECGAKGIFVSVHGGRQFAYSQCPLEVLPDVIDAVGEKVKGNVFLDTDVRTGGDALKAFCLGAKAVFVGRPALYGLRLKGPDGVYSVLNTLKSQAEWNMQSMGLRCFAELNLSAISHVEGPVAVALQRRQQRRRRRLLGLVGSAAALGTGALALAKL